MQRKPFLETLTVLVFFLFVGIILYYSFYPFKVTTLKSISIDKEEYCRGDWINVHIEFIKHMDIQAKVTWYVVDGIVFQLESPGVTRPEGDNQLDTSKQVPMSLLPGKYHLRVEMEYNVHPLHKPIINIWNTKTFTIMPSDKCPNVPPLQTKQIEVEPATEEAPQDTISESPKKENSTGPAQVGGTEVSVTPSKAAVRRLLEKVNILNSAK